MIDSYELDQVKYNPMFDDLVGSRDTSYYYVIKIILKIKLDHKPV